MSYSSLVYRKQGGAELVVASGGSIDVESGGTLELAGTAITATAAELNAVADTSGRLVSAGATLAVTVAAHDGRIIVLDALAGSVCTLPSAAGTGAIFRFVVGVLATSVSHIVKVTTTDVMAGLISTVDSDTAGTIRAWATAADSDTITLNRSTTGSVTRGEWLEVIDYAAGLWLVKGVLSGTGDGATPFSAAV